MPSAHTWIRPAERIWSSPGLCSLHGSRRRPTARRACRRFCQPAGLISATSLAKALGLVVKNAVRPLDNPLANGVTVETTYRSERRLFGRKG
jgi:hypothetical protein